LPEYKYNGGYGCTYPAILVPGEGSLSVMPGDVRELDEPPDKVWWVPVEPEVPEDKPPIPSWNMPVATEEEGK
jgi:hypothetical protein